MVEYEYMTVKCPHCECKFEIENTIERGFSDREDLNCPKCEKFIRRIRSDWGYAVTKILEE